MQHTVSQYATIRDLLADTLSTVRIRGTPRFSGRLRPQHAVCDGLLTLADDKRPEANRLIEG